MNFLQGRPPTSPEYISSFRIFSIQVLCNIAFGEQLLVDYGDKYKFIAWIRILQKMTILNRLVAFWSGYEMYT